MSTTPVLEFQSVSKHFSSATVLKNIDLTVRGGEVICLLGDNGAGKSTLIKIMSGVYPPSSGRILVDGEPVQFGSPRAAQERGIATVHQDAGTFPLMSVARNFFLGHEPTKGWGQFRRIDQTRARQIALDELDSLGIRGTASADQLVGTMSGGESQALAIARALHFGARLLILDEPTSALGVKEAGIVLKLIRQAKARNIAIVFITHNAHHALSVGDQFAVLIHGSLAARFSRGERTREELLNLMAGGEELESLEVELEELDGTAIP